MKKWTRWQDWVAIAAGLFAALSTIWFAHAGASVALMLVLGVLLIISGLVNLAMPGMVAMEWVQGVLGVLLFVSPWAGAYTTAMGAAWTSWICGIIAVVVALLAIQPSMKTHHKVIPH
jgi:SPW repeat.